MTATALREQVRSALIHRFDVDFSLHQKPAPELLGGFPRGTVSEIYGPPSSGRTSVLVSALAQATGSQEFCALIDASDTFDPGTAEQCGVHLPRLLWIRCNGNAEHALKAADLLVQAGGFGMIAMDLADLPVREARRISLASWFRVRHAAEKTNTALLVVSQEVNAKSCSAVQLETRQRQIHWSGNLLEGLTLQTVHARRGAPEKSDVRLSIRPR